MNSAFAAFCLYGLSAVFCACAEEPDPVPVLCLSFDERTDPLRDSAGKHTAAAAPEDARPAWVSDGRFGGALAFDGQDDCAVIKPAPDLDFGAADSFTVELWVKVEALSAESIAPIACKGNGKTGWDVRHHHQYRLGVFPVSDGRVVLDRVLLCPENSNGKWRHLAFVRDAAERKLRLYVDAKQVCEKDDLAGATLFQPDGAPLYLGRDRSGQRHFRGLIDELTVFAGAKRHFSLTQRPVEKVDAGTAYRYEPAAPQVEPPAPEVAESWNTLERYGLNIVPAPKRMRVTGAPLGLNPRDWAMQVFEDDIDAGVALVNRRLTECDGEPLAASSAGSNRIIVGSHARMAEFLPGIGSPECPPEQGYVIGTSVRDGATTIVVAGADRLGTLYGCVTLALLVHKGEAGPRLHPVEIADWPDFKHRVGAGLRTADVESSKNAVDWAFMTKQNVVYVQGMYQYVSDIVATAEQRRIVYDYARARGIRVLLLHHTSVDHAPAFNPATMPGYSHLYYPYKTDEGLLANSQYSKGRAYTWCRDDLIDKRGRELSELLNATGVDMLALHAMDCGGRENPGNWANRTPMDRERWGNDRAAAEANLMNRVYRVLTREVRDPVLISIQYPYGTGYLKYPEVAASLKRLSALLDKDIYNCVRENVRDEMADWMVATAPHPNLIYHEPWPWSYRLFFSCSARYARTFYFADRNRDIYLFFPGNDMVGEVFSPQMATAAEYAWNTEAPGWGWFPKDADEMPRADERVPDVTERLLPRALAMVYGAQAAPYLAAAFRVNLSGRLAGDLSQFRGAPFLGYFRFKSAEAEAAVRNLEEAARHIPPRAEGSFGQTLKTFRAAATLNRARYMQLEAREKLANDQPQQAEELMRAAAAAIESVELADWLKRIWAGPLKAELDVADSIKWFKERAAYLKRVEPRQMRIGVYNQGWYRGIVSGLTKAAGIETAVFEGLATDSMKEFDAVMFNACRDTGDVDGDWRGDLRRYVEDGGGAVFTHNAVGRYAASSFGSPVFPEVCAGVGRQIVDAPELTVSLDLDGAFKAGDKYSHGYYDHLTVRPGPTANVLMVNRFDEPVTVSGKVGKGFVIYTGEIFGLNRKDNDAEPQGENWRMLFHLLRHAVAQRERP